VAFLVDKDVLWFERLGKGKSWLAFLVTDKQQPMLWVCIDILESLTTKLTRNRQGKRRVREEIYNLPFSFFFLIWFLLVGEKNWYEWFGVNDLDKKYHKKMLRLDIYLSRKKQGVCMCLGFFFYSSFLGDNKYIGLDI